MAVMAASAAVYQSDSSSRDVITQPSSALYASRSAVASLLAEHQDIRAKLNLWRSIDSMLYAQSGGTGQPRTAVWLMHMSKPGTISTLRLLQQDSDECRARNYLSVTAGASLCRAVQACRLTSASLTEPLKPTYNAVYEHLKLPCRSCDLQGRQTAQATAAYKSWEES